MEFQRAVPICTGADRLTAVPSPTSPCALCPQHHRVLSAWIPQLACPIEVTVVQLASPTLTGLVRMLLLVPLPTWPKALYPQHHSEASFRSAHVCFAPAATAFQAAVPILVGRIVSVSPLVPFPSSP